MRQISGCQPLVLVVLLSALSCKTLGLPAISTYSAMRSEDLDGDGSDSDLSSSPSAQDFENYKLLHEIANTMARPRRHADGLFTSGYSKLLGQLSAKEYLDSLMGKRISDDLDDDQLIAKRHSDAVFTDNYSRYRKQMAVKKFLNSVLTGKRSPEDTLSMPEEAIL
ncbi:vasoactive intestinal peptide b [Clupea harengus]|uniref:Vasoactive intestinal peptide b n=1 Tax=Clupea harengus TaxID=7950 RepID=A0A6P8F4J6_CLUHA|nr:vasoactive intestinal peptide b [Clupea harengus]XP_031418042.1 vasoactive intestinal peptide b [Clupea harengus]